MRIILLPGSILKPWWGAPLNFSGCRYIKIGYSHQQHRARFTNQFTGKRGMTQNNKLLIQIF